MNVRRAREFLDSPSVSHDGVERGLTTICPRDAHQLEPMRRPLVSGHLRSRGPRLAQWTEPGKLSSASAQESEATRKARRKSSPHLGNSSVPIVIRDRRRRATIRRRRSLRSTPPPGSSSPGKGPRLTTSTQAAA